LGSSRWSLRVSPKTPPHSQKGQVKKPKERRSQSRIMGLPTICWESLSAQAHCILGERMMPRHIEMLTSSGA
jgi:hypothetical protein